MNRYTITSKSELNGKRISQIQYVSKDYLVSESEGTYVIYLPDLDSHFSVNIENKTLVKMDFTNVNQLSTLKEVISKIIEVEVKSESKEFCGYTLFGKHFFKKIPNLEIESTVWIGNVSGLKNTCWKKGSLVNEQSHIVDFNLLEEQMLFEVDTCLFISEQMIISKLKISKIDSYIQQNDLFLSFLEFKIH